MRYTKKAARTFLPTGHILGTFRIAERRFRRQKQFIQMLTDVIRVRDLVIQGSQRLTNKGLVPSRGTSARN